MSRWLWSMSLVIGIVLTIVPSSADEGMWTFDNPPRAQWRDRYGFDPSPAWLDHLRLSSIRLNDGGSASFVSRDGLLITNQHVAGGQLQKVSAANRDFVRLLASQGVSRLGSQVTLLAVPLTAVALGAGPQQMGTLFKALALTAPGLGAPAGFP